MKISMIIEVYKALKEAKLTKMESKEKFAVIRIMRAVKPVAEEWDAFLSTVDEKLRGEGHEEMVGKIQQWQKEGEQTTLTEEERREVNAYIMRYNREREELLHSELAKDVEVKFEPLTDEAFERFLDSNDMTVEVLGLLSEAICK